MEEGYKHYTYHHYFWTNGDLANRIAGTGDAIEIRHTYFPWLSFRLTTYTVHSNLTREQLFENAGIE